MLISEERKRVPEAVIVLTAAGCWLLDDEGLRQDWSGRQLDDVVEHCKQRGLHLREIRSTWPCSPRHAR